MKHSHDNGNLTLFSDGNEILIACDQGHYWTFEAHSGKVPTATPGTRRDLLVPEGLERFGPAAIEALRPEA